MQRRMNAKCQCVNQYCDSFSLVTEFNPYFLAINPFLYVMFAVRDLSLDLLYSN